jgi:DNA-directed RNA polymerase specialized sigma24 family protein
MDFSGEDLEQLRPRVRYKVSYDVGFACPDVDDIVQEALMRFMLAVREDKIRDQAALGAFLNGICRNVVSEYRRRNSRDQPMPEVPPEPPPKSIADADLFDLR